MDKTKSSTHSGGHSSSLDSSFVRRFMRDLQLTHAQMAGIFNVSERQIPRWLTAKASPGAAHIAKMREMVKDPRLPLVTNKARTEARIERSPTLCFAVGVDKKLRATSRVFDARARNYYQDAYSSEKLEPISDATLDRIFHFLDLTTVFRITLFGEEIEVTCVLIRPDGGEVWGVVEIVSQPCSFLEPVTSN